MTKKILILTIAILLILSSVSFASENNTSTTTRLAVVTANILNVRTGPGINNTRIAQVSRDDAFYVVSRQSGWVRIVLTNGRTGWVSGNFVTLRDVPAQQARVTAGALNVRTGPGLNFSRIAIAHNGATLPVLVERNGWVQVQLPSGRYGWVSGNFVTLRNISTSSPAAPAPQPTQTTSPAQPQPSPEPSPSYQIQQYEQAVFQLVNVERQNHGLRPLQMDTKLFEVARVKSRDMHDNRYFSHTSPVYGSPFDMMRRFGISYRLAGENIAAGQTSPEAVVRAWMNSPGHRANILNPNFTHIGVGYHNGPNNFRHYWTQLFVGR
ncbi:CAP domain-containing protein [Dethiobacter alkaliphilus]|uniref:CAP domain-containing protein n=1 Tax=Dethiobacter alkaliphilus TaxID=427926 RepID=UPI0022261E03|nr:CAP domain-containing protein [Dethiobacter alkaliphilus]MCW3489452.1 CAP domain-containing protein [Dethiobacter alkaliphilus]